MTKEKIEFFEKYAGMAIEQQQKYGIPASVTLAQAWWERGQAAENENNMFGIKADPAWIKAGGKFGEYKDDEKELSKFRSYEKIEHSFEDHSRFLLENKRYSSAYGCSSDDYHGWLSALQKGGYSTNGNYVANLEREIKDYGLDKYDRMAIEQANKYGITVGYMRGNMKGLEIPVQRPEVAQSAQSSGKVEQEHFRMPIEGYSNMEMTSPFGMRKHPTTGKWTQHNGIDIAVPTGTKLFSTEDRGIVKRVNWGVDGNGDGKADLDKNGNPIINGKCVEVEYKHGNDTYTVQYLHMSRVDVKEGQEIDHNTLLGLSGATGRGTGAHLHYGVMKNGEYINPVSYLADIAVLSESNAKIQDLKNGRRDVLAMEKGKVNSEELLAHKADLDRQTVPGNDLAQNQQQVNAQQQSQADQNQQQQVNTPNGLATFLFGERAAKELKMLGGLESSGDLFADLFSVIVAGAVSMCALVNGLPEKQIQDEMNQKGDADENKKYDATIDPTIVDRLRAEGVDPKEMKNMAQMNAEAQFTDLDQQKQQQRGLTMG